jgi:hypothetical protein
MPKIQCACKRVLTYRDDQAGHLAKCPACAAMIRLPGFAVATPGVKAPKPQPPGATDALVMLNQRLQAQAAPAPMLAPRKDAPLAAQPGRTAPGHVMPNNTMKLEPADADIPLAGEVPAWGSEPKPDEPNA